MQIDQTRRWVGIIRRVVRATPGAPGPAAQGEVMRGASASLAGNAVALGSKPKPSGFSEVASSAADMPALEQVIASRVAAIDRDSPQRERQAFRVFLESILLDEFGADLMSDAAFAPWVEQVLQRMEADPALSIAIHEAGAWLLTAPDATPGSH